MAKKPALRAVKSLSGGRPLPPKDLCPTAKSEWLKIVGVMPSDWFGQENLALLKLHVQGLAEAQALSEMVRKVRPLAMECDESYQRYRELVKMLKEQTTAAFTVATKMRLTQQSRYGARGADTARGRAPKGSRPWEGSDEFEQFQEKQDRIDGYFDQ